MTFSAVLAAMHANDPTTTDVLHKEFAKRATEERNAKFNERMKLFIEFLQIWDQVRLSYAFEEEVEQKTADDLIFKGWIDYPDKNFRSSGYVAFRYSHATAGDQDILVQPNADGTYNLHTKIQAYHGDRETHQDLGFLCKSVEAVAENVSEEKAMSVLGTFISKHMPDVVPKLEAAILSQARQPNAPLPAQQSLEF